VVELPDPEWYLDNVLAHATPGRWMLVEEGPAAAWQRWWAAQAEGDGVLSSLLRRQGFVIAPGQLPTIGMSRQRARTLVCRGVWAAAARGTWAPIDLRDPRAHVEARRRHAVRSSALARRRPGHVVSGRSAAVLHGLPTFAVPRDVELTALADARPGRRSPAHVRKAALQVEEATNWFGVPVTTVARTIADLARHDRRDAIMAADAALREGLVDPPSLAAQLGRAAGWPGVRQARAVLALADPRAESPLESLTRLALCEAGFPPPRLQAPIPGTPYRVDMLWPSPRLVLEADGLDKYTDAEWRREKRREQRLRALGYRVERVTWDDVVRRWPETRERIRSALRLPGRTG
jgi:very-short-patch-repair endonuclease